MTGGASAGFEIDDTELFAKRDVVEGFEVELADRGRAALDFAAVVLAADRRVGVSQVWNGRLDGTGFAVEFVVLSLGCFLLLAEAAALFLHGVAFGGILGLADHFGHFVGLAIGFFNDL